MSLAWWARRGRGLVFALSSAIGRVCRAGPWMLTRWGWWRISGGCPVTALRLHFSAW